MNTVTATIQGATKALLSGVIAGAAAGAVAAADDRITTGEWWAIAAAALTGAGVVYGVPNTGPRAPQNR